LKPGNTTRTGDIPGGLGLKRLRDFIQQNDGQLHIVSGNGCWIQRDGKLDTMALSCPFNGTLINLSFNTLDDNLYNEDDHRIQEVSLF